MSKLKAFEDDNFIVVQVVQFVFDRLDNVVLPAFSPFPTMFSKDVFLRGAKSRPRVETDLKSIYLYIVIQRTITFKLISLQQNPNFEKDSAF